MMTINDNDFQRLVSFIRGKYGINLEHKRQLINARLAFDITRRGYDGFTKYISEVILDPDGDECAHMMNKLSTNYTFFFREPDYIAQLCDVVLKAFLAKGKTKIKIWSAACSSGQEAYSVAMVLELQKKLFNMPIDYEIFGTDINTETLSMASSGIYPDDELKYIPKLYMGFITHHVNGTFQISDKIRNKISWKYKNLLDPTSETEKYDIIFCRNVMIYFTPQLRREMTAKLCEVLQPGGYLYTGTTESIDLERKYFRYIAPAFYQKNEL